MDKIEVVTGDITQQQADAVVNAANSSRRGGRWVDGAIHRAAGPGLLQECRGLGGCGTGDAKIASGYDLPGKWVEHIVGPVWNGGGYSEGELLASCYRRCLGLAGKHSTRTIAFPAINTEAYGFPVQSATRLAVTEVAQFPESNSGVERVPFACFDDNTALAYDTVVAELDRDHRVIRSA